MRQMKEEVWWGGGNKVVVRSRMFDRSLFCKRLLGSSYGGESA